MPNDTHYAFVVGINDYTPPDKKGLQPLKGAINDANAMYDWLTSANGGDIPKENVRKIVSTFNPLTPIREGIDDELFQLLDKAGRSAKGTTRFYFYFAGHGLGVANQDDNNGLCYSTWTSVMVRRALSSRDYKNLITALQRFDEVIFFTDCCRNLAYKAIPESPSFQAEALGIPGEKDTKYFYAYGTGNDTKTYEIEKPAGTFRGLFTTVLIDALEGDAANDAGEIDHDSLKNYLVVNTFKQAQGLKLNQKPDVHTNFDILSKLVVKSFDLEQAKTECNFLFSNERVNPIQLLDEKAMEIARWDANVQKNASEVLRKGMYSLYDTVTKEKKPFNTSPGKAVINVEF